MDDGRQKLNSPQRRGVRRDYFMEVYTLSSIVYRLSSIVYRLSSIVYRLSSIVYRLSSIVH